MPYRVRATVTSKGQITLPATLRRRWDIKAGDQIDFTIDHEDRVVLTKKGRRSILRARAELAPLSLGRPLRQSDIDLAVADAMASQELRVRKAQRR